MSASYRGLTRRIDDAKERVLGAGGPVDAAAGPGDDVVGEQVLASWRRSQFWGVSTDRLEPPYSDELDLDGQLSVAARPVLDHLAAALSGTAMSIILTDAQGRILQRRTGEGTLDRHLDAISLAPGFSYAEEFVGTNGIGSAIESRKPFFVAGAEHFVRSLATVSCAGAPILAPLTGRLQGVIDLTCRASDANGLMKVLVEEAAAEINQRLLELGSVRQRNLLSDFLTASHNSSRAVVAVIGDLVISNARATGTLDRGDYALVQDHAADMVRGGVAVREILLSSGDTAYLRARPAGSAERGGGVIVELTLTGSRAVAPVHPAPTPTLSPSPPGPTGMVGRSGAWSVTWERVERSCRRRERLLLVGERGSGKLTLLTAAHQRARPATGVVRVLDLSAIGARDPSAIGARDPSTIGARDPVEEVAAALERQLEAGTGTVVLRRLDALPEGARGVVAAWIDRQDDEAGPWIVGTLRAAGVEEAPGLVTAGFSAVVAVPALRYRIEDVRDLVPALIARLAPGRDGRVGPDAMQTLLRNSWPGNVTELDDVLRSALGRRPSGRITAEDLPETAHCTSRQVLSPWEAMERDLVTRALIEAKGDKALAAERLGISRATIYRKVRAYGIVLDGLTTS